MKRNRTSIGLTAWILAVMLILCGCQKNGPQPVDDLIEASSNSFGARYIFTRSTFTEMASGALEDEDIVLKANGWETITGDLVDDNGVKYSSYCNRTDDLTFTVAVENESGKVMNVGCGCDSKLLSDDSFRERFVRISAITALTAGGYDPKNRDYFVGIFNDLLDGDDEIVSYGGSLYIKSVDDAATVLMTAPCSDDVIENNRYRAVDE